MRLLRIHAAAAEEAAQAAAWYDKERPGLGAEFARAVEAALDLLEEDFLPLSPVPGVAGTRGVKRLLLKRFPFAVIVRPRAGETDILAFAHSSRRPGYWRDRLKV